MARSVRVELGRLGLVLDGVFVILLGKVAMAQGVEQPADPLGRFAGGRASSTDFCDRRIASSTSPSVLATSQANWL